MANYTMVLLLIHTGMISACVSLMSFSNYDESRKLKNVALVYVKWSVLLKEKRPETASLSPS